MEVSSVDLGCNSCMVLSMFFRLVLANSLFSLRDINLTLGLLPPRGHVVWRYYVGVKSARIFFIRTFSGCCGILTREAQKGQNSYGYNPALF